MLNSIPEHIATVTATSNTPQKQMKLAQAFGKWGQTILVAH